MFDPSGQRAVGVEYEQGGETKVAHADKVILSGGAINSPQLLMLSGVGPAEHLREVGVEVVRDLPGVGRNLQDHLVRFVLLRQVLERLGIKLSCFLFSQEVYVVQRCTKPISLLKDQWGPRMVKVGAEWFLKQTGMQFTYFSCFHYVKSCVLIIGPARTAHLESGGFCRSRPGVEHPDIMFHFLPSQVSNDIKTTFKTAPFYFRSNSLFFQVIDHGRKAAEVEAFQVHVGPMRPTSRGFLELKSKDPREHPRIDPKYLSTGEKRVHKKSKSSRETSLFPAFLTYVKVLSLKAPRNSSLCPPSFCSVLDFD